MGDKKRKKSNDQKNWELRKLKMAGIDTKEIEDVSDEKCINIYLKHEYIKSSIKHTRDNLFDFKNEMYLIGNRTSLFYEKYKIKPKLSKDIPVGTKNISVTNFDYKQLPVYRNKKEFLEIFEKYNSLVLTGETGCGKSTLIPKFIYDKYKYNICITQPRRISVKSLYERMKIFYNSEVGYAVRFDQNFSKDTRIKFVTEGVLLKEIAEDRLLTKYDVIICDEVHERSVNLDIILGFLKLLTKTRSNLKIILMSATLQIEKFTRFLDCFAYNFSGLRYPIDIKYLKANVDDYIEWITKKILYVHKNEPEGDILVFLTGKEDIYQINHILSTDISLDYDELIIIPLYSENYVDVYDKIFNLTTKTRKCILSTNLSEASVTIPNIKYVIDSGLQKISYYDYNQGDRLIKYPISKESSIQRSGRAGRTMAGTCYRMYTEETFHKLFKDVTVPDILRTNISNVILIILSANFKQIKDFPFITCPSENIISSGIDNLIFLEAIDNGLNITDMGKDILKLGLDPLLGRLINIGIMYNCSYEASLLASILSLDVHNLLQIFEKYEDLPEYNQCINVNSDFISLINLFNWGFRDKTIVPHLVSRVKFLQNNILSRLRSIGKKITHSSHLDLVIMISFYFNLCERNGNCYRNLFTRLQYKIFDSYVDGKYVVFYKSFITRKNEHVLQICAKLEPNDILSHLGKYFTDDIKFKTNHNIIKVNPYEKLYDRFILESDEEFIN